MYMPAPSEDTMIMYCGPSPFVKNMEETLIELGHQDKNNLLNFHFY